MTINHIKAVSLDVLVRRVYTDTWYCHRTVVMVLIVLFIRSLASRGQSRQGLSASQDWGRLNPSYRSLGRQDSPLKLNGNLLKMLLTHDNRQV
jgi:hypothetical protein